jgi:hypothetical protein
MHILSGEARSHGQVRRAPEDVVWLTDTPENAPDLHSRQARWLVSRLGLTAECARALAGIVFGGPTR